MQVAGGRWPPHQALTFVDTSSARVPTAVVVLTSKEPFAILPPLLRHRAAAAAAATRSCRCGTACASPLPAVSCSRAASERRIDGDYGHELFTEARPPNAVRKQRGVSHSTHERIELARRNLPPDTSAHFGGYGFKR